MEVVALTVIGLAAGLLGGLLGIGGSLIMIPAMTEVLGPNQHVYQAAAMIVNVFVAVPAVIQHRRAGAVDVSTVVRLLPLAVFAVLVGVLLSEAAIFVGPGEAYLRGLFAAFLLSTAAYDLFRLFRSKLREKRGPGASGTDGSGAPAGASRRGWLFSSAVAIPTGLVAGLLGVGGGMLAVPLQRRVLGVPIRVAIANSATMIVAIAAFGAVFKNYALMTRHGSNDDSLLLAAALIPTAVLGSYVGSRLTHRLPLRTVKGAFLILMIVVGVRLATRAAADRPTRTPNADAMHFDNPRSDCARSRLPLPPEPSTCPQRLNFPNREYRYG